jgi:hypothetical protein
MTAFWLIAVILIQNAVYKIYLSYVLMLIDDCGWLCFAPKFIGQLQSLTFLLNYVVSLIHILPLPDFNCVDEFVAFI